MDPEGTQEVYAQPEALITASKGSGVSRVKLFVNHVYNGSNSQEVTLATTDTVSDLKKMLQELFEDRPAPHQQRIIFSGKQCQEGQQIGHVLRGMDLSDRHTIHLVVPQPSERKPSAKGAAEDDQASSADRKCDDGHNPPSRVPGPAAPGDSSAEADPRPIGASRTPERVELNPTQTNQLRWQYFSALQEQERALYEQHARYHFLARQFNSFGDPLRQNRPASGEDGSREYPVHFVPQWRVVDASEVASSIASRALDGDMPGPAAGGTARDVTNGARGMIQSAGLDEGGRPAVANLVDPPVAPPPPPVNWVRLFIKLVMILGVFAIDAKAWQLMVLGLGAALVFLFKTGILAVVLGSEREGGGLWRVLCNSASVIPEGGGLPLDILYFFTSFIFSLFPPWKPVRSPRAIQAEAAARVAEAAARVAEAETAMAAAATQRANEQQAASPPVADDPVDDAAPRGNAMPEGMEM